MTVRIANRIYIDDPTGEVEQWAKDNLEFPNPEYEKKQRMGFWVGRTPKVLRLYEWDGHTLILPFGVCREIMPMIWNVPIECDFRQDEEIDYGDPVPLYDYQQEAVEQMAGKKYGILKSAAGSGKTQMGIALIKQLKRRALWLCHTHDLLIQSRDRALRYMDESLIGTITEGKVNIGTGVTFATVQTMANLDLPLYRDCWDTVIIDECHRVGSSATTFTRYERVLNNLSARHKYGLTATPERSDGLIKATFSFLGQVAWEVDEDKIADRIMKATVRKVSTDAEITDDCLNVDGTINYIQLIDHLTHDPERNKLIARKIIEEKGHSCLILSERLEHLEAIRNLLPYEMQEESAYITGKMQSKKAKAEREQAIEDMRSGKKKYLFASYSLAKEGLDIQNLDRLFMASPVKFSSVVIQSIGRIERACKGKGTPVAYDFVDTEIGFCDRAYRERKKHYRKIGVTIDETWFMDR